MNFVKLVKKFKSVIIHKGLICFVNILQFFSLSLASKFGSVLFVTPFGIARPSREKMFYNSAQKKTLRIKSIQKEVEVLSYGYSKKKVLFVHGWAGRSSQIYVTADKLLEKSYMLISFDGPAHGNSTGKTTSMPEFVYTILEIDKQLGPFEVAIGHSFGGLCLYNAISEGLTVKKLITMGTCDKISDIILDFTNKLKLKPIIAKKIKTIYDKRWQIDIDKHSSSTVAKQVKIPTLVIHDSLDRDVNVSCAVSIRQNLQKGSLFITQGLGHIKMLRNKSVTEKMISFILDKKHLSN
ncbi:MAG: alpha/beta fold hydrolase [Tenacibaculum sp.]